MRNEFTRTASAEEILILSTPKFKDLLLLSKSVKIFDHTGLSFHLISSPSMKFQREDEQTIEEQGSHVQSPEEELAGGRRGLGWAPCSGAEEASAEENEEQPPEGGGRKPKKH